MGSIRLHMECLDDAYDYMYYIFLVVTSPIWVSIEGITKSVGSITYCQRHLIAKNFAFYKRFLFGAQVIWVGLIIGILGGKFYGEGIIGTAKYFTNVSLLIQGVYLFLDLISYFCDPRHPYLTKVLLYSFFFPVFANSFDVFFMVVFVYLDNAGILTSNLEAAGGKYNDGLVLGLDRAYHVFPLLFFVMAYIPCRINDISRVYQSVYGILVTNPEDRMVDSETGKVVVLSVRERTRVQIGLRHGITYIIFQFAVSLIPYALYSVVANVDEVYDLDTFTDWMGLLGVIGLNLICVVLFLFVILFYYIPSQEITDAMARKLDTLNA